MDAAPWPFRHLPSQPIAGELPRAIDHCSAGLRTRVIGRQRHPRSKSAARPRFGIPAAHQWLRHRRLHKRGEKQYVLHRDRLAEPMESLSHIEISFERDRDMDRQTTLRAWRGFLSTLQQSTHYCADNHYR